MTALDISSPADTDRRALLRAFIWGTAVSVCASAMLIALTIAAAPVFAPFYIALLTPMTLPIALPIGLTLGIAFGLSRGLVSRVTKRAVLFSAVLVTVVSFSSMAWVKPVANQAFRQSVFNAIGGKGTVVKGLHEMSIPELRRAMNMAPRGDVEQTPQRAIWIYQLTFALPLAPLVLAMLALTLVARGTRRATVMAMCVAYFVVLMATEALVYEGLVARRRRMDTKRTVRGCNCVPRVIAAAEHPGITEPGMIPGVALHRLAAHICSAKTLERVVEPAIADLQKEYCGAGDLRARVRILLAGYVAILKVIAMCALSVSLESADERRAVARTLAWSVTMVVITTVTAHGAAALSPSLVEAMGYRGDRSAAGVGVDNSPWSRVRYCVWFARSADQAHRENDARLRIRGISVELRRARVGRACGEPGI